VIELGHAIPDDDYAHREDMHCGCGPFVHAIPGFGAAVCHRRIDAEPVPDYPPADPE
jgi:hypothetical protein